MISIKLFCNLNEITLRHGSSPVNFLHIFRTPFFKNILVGSFSYWLCDFLRKSKTANVTIKRRCERKRCRRRGGQRGRRSSIRVLQKLTRETVREKTFRISTTTLRKKVLQKLKTKMLEIY